MIRAVTFDLWQTLITEKPEEEERRRILRYERMLALLNELGKPSTLGALEEAYRACGEWLHEVWKENKDVSTRDQVDFVLRRLDKDPRLSQTDWERLEEAYVSPIRDIPPVALPGAREALRTLSLAGVCLGLICNTGRTPGRVLRPLLEGMGLRAYFNAMAFSDELRVRKPDERIFMKVLTDLQTRPEQAVHVGDIAETDVAGAKRAGLLALHLVRDGSKPSPEADGVLRSAAEVPDWIANR